MRTRRNCLRGKNAKSKTGDFCITHAWANDYDRDTCKTYIHNIRPQSPDSVVCGDVRKLDISTFGEIDAFAFGFPCNDFSIVGEQKGFDGTYGPLYQFVFMLRLLADNRIQHLTEELAKIVVVEAENESDRCFEYIVSRILEFRNVGNACLEPDFVTKYDSSKGEGSTSGPYAHLSDFSNALINWIEYTQLAKRNDNGLEILEDKRDKVAAILSNPPSFIDRPTQREFFQRKYEIDPKHRKDTRNLTGATTITARIIAKQKVRNAFITESLKQPISCINSKIVDRIIEQTEIEEKMVEETLLKYYPNGSIGAFMTEYFEMVFKGRDEATAFEKATVEKFRDVFGFEAKHVGPIGLTPDVLILSDGDGFSGIIDNKAYSRYTINNDYHNRMVHNSIENMGNYYDGHLPLAFFSYIAGGFGANINSQLQSITTETGVADSAMNVSNMIELIKKYQPKGYTHAAIKDIFSLGRQVLRSDIMR